MHLDQYTDLHVHEDLMNKMQNVINTAAQVIEESQTVREQITLHNNDPLSHPDLRDKIIHTIENAITSDYVDDAIHKHDQSSSAHNALFGQIRIFTQNTQNDLNNTKIDLSNLENKVDQGIENSKQRDINILNQHNADIQATRDFATTSISLHNIDTNAHKNIFDVVNETIITDKEELKQDLINHNVSTSAHDDLRKSLQQLRTDFDNALPKGTRMFFQQSAAPTGWIKQTTRNDVALRLVSGNVSERTNGMSFTVCFDHGRRTSSVTPSGWIGQTSLANNALPWHRHHTVLGGQRGDPCCGWHGDDTITTEHYDGCNCYRYGEANASLSSSAGGQGGSHAHSLNMNSHDHELYMDVNYIDVILAEKA